ncbi:hypothetical protein [Pedobacter sp. SYP-B3415]|uniref:hypothetical protein n=1 Tax=Pedobacter sp. SYP-B3415 TaxID=2496641 RepID=UPI00101D9FB1|nr:hypothetical protein [Pedobacter sp. SYP-B3415]
MFLGKYKVVIACIFIFVFLAKMGISGAPVFFKCADKKLMNAVIMQLELEHGNEKDSSKEAGSYPDYKLIDFLSPGMHHPILTHIQLNNSFIDHNRRYVDPYHPTVPTPPPNVA